MVDLRWSMRLVPVHPLVSFQPAPLVRHQMLELGSGFIKMLQCWHAVRTEAPRWESLHEKWRSSSVTKSQDVAYQPIFKCLLLVDWMHVFLWSLHLSELNILCWQTATHANMMAEEHLC